MAPWVIDYSPELHGYTLTIHGRLVLDGATGGVAVYRMPVALLKRIAENLAR